MNPFDNITITENVSMSLSLPGTLSQSVSLSANTDYRIHYVVTLVGSMAVQLGTDYYRTITTGTTTVDDTFSHGAGSGSYTLSFSAFTGITSLEIDNVSLKEELSPLVEENLTIKEALSGNTDEGREIVFRADTQVLQIQTSPEMYSQPITVLTETERGSMMKAFVSLDDKPFYEIEGTTTKGTSNLKIGLTPDVMSDMSQNADNPIAQSMQISYRDSSKQRPRLIQAAVITIPTPIDHSP